ncbi:MAG: DUF1501 domain-containing protein [Deltaproteobacteria bacterium]|nr:DUF1501 domain-containing protein [Deltaproteobacteria bacterium]
MKKQFTRRDFLKAALATSASGMFGLAIKPSTALAAGQPFKVLVKIELLGGCDSHCIWLPTNSAKFAALNARRPGAMFAANPSQTLDIGYSQGIGLHPNLSQLIPHIPHTRFFLNTSNAKSYGQSGSHEDAQNIMTMGTKDFNGKFQGWTARIYDSDPTCQLIGFLGSRGANVNCDHNVQRCAESPPPTVDTFETFKLDGVNFPASMGGSNNSKYVGDVIKRLAEARPAAQQPSNVEKEFDGALRGLFPAIDEFARTVTFQSPLYSAYNSGNYFARQLRNIAMKIKQLTMEPTSERFIFSLGYGGFDLHENWNAPYGTPELMTTIGSALGIFMNDIQAMGVMDDVVVMTSTEFGRTLYSNQVGTDHGEGSTTIVMGGRVKGGSNAVYGDILTASEFGSLMNAPSRIDNRGIISSILNDFMGIDHTLAFPGPIADEFTIENYNLFTGLVA